MEQPGITIGRRDRDVLLALAAGFTAAQVGARLFESHAAVHAHIKHILQSLDARNEAHAIAKMVTMDNAFRFELARFLHAS